MCIFFCIYMGAHFEVQFGGGGGVYEAIMLNLL